MAMLVLLGLLLLAAPVGADGGLRSGADILGEGTRFEVGRIDPGRPLRPAGPQGGLRQDGPSAPGLDCVPFHERVERDRRRRFPQRCDPAADIDVGMPAFTTR